MGISLLLGDAHPLTRRFLVDRTFDCERFGDAFAAGAQVRFTKLTEALGWEGHRDPESRLPG